MSSIYLSNAIFMMIILTIIFLRIRYYITWSPSKKYTMIFIGMVELYVLMDALSMKELLGKSGNLLQFKLVVFFFYLVYVIMPYVWPTGSPALWRTERSSSAALTSFLRMRAT